MNNILNTSNGVVTLISRTNDGTNVLTINGTTLDESDWVGSGNYTFIDSGQTFTIKQISENTGNIILKIVDDYNYELAKISEQAEDLAELAEQVVALQNTKQNNLIAGDNIELVDNQDNTTTISSIGGEIVYGPTIYSDEEREVGVWRDGKPLYQKVYDLGDDTYIPSTTWFNNAMTISNLLQIIKCFGVNTFGTYYPLMAYHTNDSVNLLACRDGNPAQVRWIAVQYTKTTDTAGSGDWTTDGIPAVHYSTDEHVVGTWIDGKTLYEKTVYGTYSYNTPVTIATNVGIAFVVNQYYETSGVKVSPFYGTINMFVRVNSDNTLIINNCEPRAMFWNATVRYTKIS